MELESITQILIYIHAGLGGLALLAGGVAIISKKGRSLHKKSGKVFFYAMIVSAITALVVAVLPKHENPFLFSIGLFSIYFLLSGFRSLKYKRDLSGLKLDKIISYAIMLVGLGMIVIPPIFLGRIIIVLTVFGFMGLAFGFRDIKLYRKPEELKKKWLKLHLGDMTGGYIAAVSAFLVVNNVFPALLNWFLPGVIGGIFITYWIRKVDGKKSKSA